MSFHRQPWQNRKLHHHRLLSPNRIQKTLKCPSARKTLKIGENGEREDPIVSPAVDKLFPKDLSNATPYPYYTHR